MQLRLKLHPNKSVIFPASEGVKFLGHRVFRDHRLLVRDNVQRMKRRLRAIQRDYACRKIGAEEIPARLHSWIGHASHADTYRLRTRLFDRFPFCRPSAPNNG